MGKKTKSARNLNPGKSDSSMKKRKSGGKSTVQLNSNGEAGAGDTFETRSENKEQDKDGAGLIKDGSKIEWDRDAVRQNDLMTDGFSCCLVMIIEDSPQLTKYGEYLQKGVETGARKKFSCIDGLSTAERVKRYLINSGQRDPQADDDSYMDRQDSFAEAIKFSMMEIRNHVATELDADIISKEMELAGARSKEFVRRIPPVTLKFANGSPLNDEDAANRETTGAPLPTPTGELDGLKKSISRSKTKINDAGSTAPIDENRNLDASGSGGSAGAPQIGIKTRMRKRGEHPVPELQAIDDALDKGPRSYILLLGFYNPKVIEELRNIGVIVDGILLMTDEKVNRYNFSIIDVEDSIPGTFRPRNVLPQYLRAMEALAQNPDMQNNHVVKFWTMLSDMYNNSPADSAFHDIALMNFRIPDTHRAQLDTPEGLTYYISRMFDEVAQRVYEMLVLEEWFREFTTAADVHKLQPLEPQLPHEIYDQILGQIPSESISISIILEAVVQQVAYTMEKEAGGAVPAPCEDEGNLASGIVHGEENFGGTNWGVAAKGGNKKDHGHHADASQSLLKIPMYIKAGDYASIRNCHLKESLAAKIASCQLTGDVRNIQGFMWRNIPEFNRGLYAKLLGNLNHFMYFMPPDYLKFEDMYYVLHLLISAGIEIHLQKEAEKRRAKRISQRASIGSKKPSEIGPDELYYQNRPRDDNTFPGTNLDMDRNYLAVNKNTGIHFVITPNSKHELTVAGFGRSRKTDADTDIESAREKDSRAMSRELAKVRRSQSPTTPPPTSRSENTEGTTGDEFRTTPEASPAPDVDTTAHSETQEGGKSHKKALKKKKSKTKKELDPKKAARVTITNAIDDAAQIAKDSTEKEDSEKVKEPPPAPPSKKGKKSKPKKGKNKEGVETEPSTTAISTISQPTEPSPTPVEEAAPKKPPSAEVPGGAGDASDPKPTPERTEGGRPSASPVRSTKPSRAEPGKTKQTRPSGAAAEGGLSKKRQSFKDKEEPKSAARVESEGQFGGDPTRTGFGGMSQSKDRKRFIACEPEKFEDIHDTSVIQALLECPALLAISESGALDLSKWVEKYLLSCGLEVGGEATGIGTAGVLLGDLQNWNYIEELAPIQTIQMLNEASQEYLSMQRMYCPFYDTLLFIFNNPMPEELTAETQFYFRLKTLPGLQHFLDYAMTDDDVLKWIETLDAGKRLDSGETCSINTLLNFIPEEQWMLVPSIKYQLMVEGGTTASNFILPSSEKFGLQSSKTQVNPYPTRTSIGSTRSIVPSVGESLAFNSTSQQIDPSQVQSSSPETNETTTGVETIPSQIHTAESTVSTTYKTGSAKKIHSEKSLLQSALNFTCYDLGKRVAVVGNDTFYLFPMDGSVIRYDISTIEPDFRLMQLSVSKNGHQTFFYPYYVPHDFDLSHEGYVVCPYFHMVMANGTIFAFQDLRAEEAAPYIKVALKERPNQFSQGAQEALFSYEKVLFGKEIEEKLAAGGGGSSGSIGKVERALRGDEEKRDSVTSQNEGKVDVEPPKVEETPTETEPTGKGKKKGKTLKEKHSKPESGGKRSLSETKKIKKKGKKGKGEDVPSPKVMSPPMEEDPTTGNSSGAENDQNNVSSANDLGDTASTGEAPSPQAPPTPPGAEDGPAAEVPSGEWMYPSSDNSDEEEDPSKRRMFFAPPWDEAEILIHPLSHIFKVTLPSGLLINIEDIPGPPIVRVVKQSYIGQGSARSHIESSRYYTMDGSVIKFLFDGTIQILTARGVTTNIDELAANAKRDQENVSFAFGSASIVKIFNGEVILPNGNLWEVVNGKKVAKNPIYVFTTGPLIGGEIFRRRQDGVIYLHRHDGTVITHYPDGTRFTTRMVIMEQEADPEKEFSDWVFVGLKYMVEHPNYSTVLFNTLSGNVHLKLPHGEWVRCFADGNIRIATEDNYKLDVDKNRALLSYPSCGTGAKSLPNLTAVRLWHGATNSKASQPASKSVSGGATPTPDGTGMATPEVQLEPEPPATEEDHEAEQENPQKHNRLGVGKKQSKRNMQGAKSANSKVKHHGKKGKSTRISVTALGDASDSKMTVGEPRTSNTAGAEEGDIPPENISSVDQIEGRQSEGAFVPPVASEEKMKKKSEQALPKPSLRKTVEESGTADELADFLTFKEESLFCKSVDSWDNRFAMDMYGGTVVDKVKQDEESKEEAAKELIAALSDHINFPKQHLSGILKNTSSEQLDTAARRFQAFRQNYSDNCAGSLPKTKIFVVKRDLSGFQYLQKNQVDEVVTKGYGSRDSIVIVDPVSQPPQKKFITVMRPVEEVEEPHGMWTRPYIEPMFRPRGVTNKHLKVAGPSDLRWFGYIVSSAHGRRPKFVEDPKETFREMRDLNPRPTTFVIRSSDSKKESTESGGFDTANTGKSPLDPSDSLQPSSTLEKSLGPSPPDTIEHNDEEQPSNESEEQQGEEEVQVEKPAEEEQSTPVTTADPNIQKAPPKKNKKEGEKDKKHGHGKGKDKKGKRKESLANAVEEEVEISAEEMEEEEEMSTAEPSEQVLPGTTTPERKSKILKILNIEPEIDEYPTDVKELKGVYEVMERERREGPKITAKLHAPHCNAKRAVVVRSFLEIPKVDENLQRALLAASMSYAETCRTETAVYHSYRNEDPRTPDERNAQVEYKQQLIEKNIDEMHLLEQKPGPVLRFHF